jgi:hypothetical protein
MPTAGYSGTALIKKLGIKSGQRLAALNQPSNYQADLGPLPPDTAFLQELSANLDFIHFFALARSDLERQFPSLKISLVPNGMLWISWPKKSSKVESDLDGNVVRKIGLANGLVDTKVAAINEIWSGLKFVYRLGDRLVE